MIAHVLQLMQLFIFFPSIGHFLFSSGFPASNTATFSSGAFFISSYAAKIPPGPAPIMITSYLLICIISFLRQPASGHCCLIVNSNVMNLLIYRNFPSIIVSWQKNIFNVVFRSGRRPDTGLFLDYLTISHCTLMRKKYIIDTVHPAELEMLSKGIIMVKDNIIPNHMNIYWHDYTGHVKDKPITEASVPVKAALIGRVGLMLLSCGTGAWRVRSSMNALSEQLGVTCTASIGLMTIVYTCFDGHKTFTNSLALNNTGVNTSKLNQLERFVKNFPKEGVHMSGEQLHNRLDEIEQIRGLYTPVSARACCGICLLRLHFSSGRRADRDALRIHRRRRGELPSLSPDQTALYLISVRDLFCGARLSVVCPVAAAVRHDLYAAGEPRGRIYLRHAFHYSRLPVHHQRH